MLFLIVHQSGDPPTCQLTIKLERASLGKHQTKLWMRHPAHRRACGDVVFSSHQLGSMQGLGSNEPFPRIDMQPSETAHPKKIRRELPKLQGLCYDMPNKGFRVLAKKRTKSTAEARSLKRITRTRSAKTLVASRSKFADDPTSLIADWSGLACRMRSYCAPSSSRQQGHPRSWTLSIISSVLEWLWWLC